MSNNNPQIREIKYKAVLENHQRTKKFVSYPYGVDNNLWKIFKNESFFGVELVTESKKFLDEIPEDEWLDGWSITKVIQSTGLKDNNGTDIYNGDVLDKKWRMVVYFKNGAFYVSVPHGKQKKEMLLYDWLKHRDRAGNPQEIIGNKYENQELLN